MLPPTRVLAAELGIARSVVVEAYANLAADGYLEARQGSGTRVRPEIHPDAPPQRRRSHVDATEFARRPRRAAPLGSARIRLLGGLPDPALFPRAQWARHYRAALSELPDRELTYPSARGAEPLRAALARYLGRVRGVATVPERLLICSGFTQGLTLVCRALRRGGARRVAVEDPCFGLHREAIAMTGLEPVPVAVDARGLDPSRTDRPRRRRRAGRACALLPDRRHARRATGAASSSPGRGVADALIIEDDYDAEFRYGRAPIGALQGLAPDHVVYIGSASKTFSPALRLGWLAAPADLVVAARAREALRRHGLAACSSSSPSPACSTAATSPATCAACARSTATGATPRSRRSTSSSRSCAGRAPLRGCTSTSCSRRRRRGSPRLCGASAAASSSRTRLALGPAGTGGTLDRARLWLARRAGHPPRNRPSRRVHG